MKSKFYAQGDIIIEYMGDIAAPKKIQKINVDPDGAVVLARGEVTGHRHAFYEEGDTVTMFRTDEGAKGMDANLYLGNLIVKGDAPVSLKHEEHDTITLPPGMYRVRRQREWTAEQARIVAD